MKRWTYRAAIFPSLLLLIGMLALSPAVAALWDKRYVVKHNQGQDILCDPYVVQKNDWIYKIFRQKGEISERDFPTFLEIFKRMNPGVDDINRIYPGDMILIPLKIITAGTLPIDPSESVIIPFASISDRPIETVVIRKGDTVSRLIARSFGSYKSRQYQSGLRRFQELNPQISDLNQIMVGQKVRLPVPPRQHLQGSNQSTPKTDDAGKTVALSNQKTENKRAENNSETVPSAPGKKSEVVSDLLIQIASIMDAELFDRGSYHFPVRAEADWRLDLGMFPVMLLKDKTRILFIRPFTKALTDFSIVKSHWNKVRIVRIPASPVSAYQLLDKIFGALNAGNSREKITFRDKDVTVDIRAKWIHKMENIPGKPHHFICLSPVTTQSGPLDETLFRYLAKHHIAYWEIKPDGQITGTTGRKNHYQGAGSRQSISALKPKQFLGQLASTLGWAFRENIKISFPYAGIQVNAVSNMLSIDPDHSCLVDFGSFAGDSIAAIEATGLKVASLSNIPDAWNQMHHLFTVLSIAYTQNPTIAVRNLKDGHGIFLACPGLLVHQTDGQVLFTPSTVSNGIKMFLEKRGTQVIRIES